MGDDARIWKWMVGLLTLLNIILLITIWQKPPHSPPPGDGKEGPAQRIIHDLQLDGKQQQQFETLKREHRRAMEQFRERGQQLRDEYFDLLKQPSPDSVLVHAKARAIAKNQEDIELVTFDHFRKVRQVCDPQQQKKFDEIIKDVLHTMAGPPGRKRD
jgi:Spy/CpxP family protein refolding chaperone